MVYVLSGTLRITVGLRSFNLEEGESATFGTSEQHVVGHAEGSKLPVMVLSVSVQPQGNPGIVKAWVLGCLALLAGCSNQTPPKAPVSQIAPAKLQIKNPGRVIHVLVALCDNKYQGIQPVPAHLGNGDDLVKNLYWGSAYGVKAYFRHKPEWKLIADWKNPKPKVLERVVFKHATQNVYMVADAYRGREIKQATLDCLRFSGGWDVEPVQVASAKKTLTLGVGGGADMCVYVGHDGLMDFRLTGIPSRADSKKRDTVLLACMSEPYFREAITITGARPILWTTGLMAPEAYVLEAAVDGWIKGENGEKIRERAARAYDKYQHCGLKGARRLFATGL